MTLSNLDNVNAREEKNPHRDQPPLPSPDVHTLSAAIDAGKGKVILSLGFNIESILWVTQTIENFENSYMLYATR